MKYLFVLLFLVPTLAQADFTSGLIVGSIISSGPKTTTVEVKDEFAKQVEQIEQNLPRSYEPVTKPFYHFYVLKSEAPKYLNYFKNGGYDVTYQEGSISFNLSSRYEAYLDRQKQREEEQKAFDKKMDAWKPYLKVFGILFLLGIVLIALVKTLIDMHRWGVLNWFYQIEKKMIARLIKEIKSRGQD